jgi:hypothetical protein
VILTFDKKCRFEDYDSIYQDFPRNVDFSRYPEYVPENGGQIAGMNIPFFDSVQRNIECSSSSCEFQSF